MQVRGPSRLGALAVAAGAATVASAQYLFNPGTLDSEALFEAISADYYSYAAIWNYQLSDAKASHTGAYAVLTSIYGTDEVPAEFDASFVSRLAGEMESIGETTVVDHNVNSATLTFITDGSVPTPSSDSSATTTTTSSSESVFSVSDSGDSSGAASIRSAAALCVLAAGAALAASSGFF